jgi:hypothetical protein
MCWAILGKKISGRDFRTKEEMFAALEAAWDEIDQQTIDHLVADFPRRLELVEAVGGEDDFAEEEDAEIEQFIDAQARCRWKALHEKMPHRSAKALTQRSAYLHLSALKEWWSALRAEFEDAPEVVWIEAPRDTENPHHVPGDVAFSKECVLTVAEVAAIEDRAERAKVIGLLWRSLSDVERASYGRRQVNHRPNLRRKRGRKPRRRPDSDSSDSESASAETMEED